MNGTSCGFSGYMDDSIYPWTEPLHRTPEQCPAELSSSFVISNNVTVILSNTLRGFAILHPQSERRAGV